MEWFVIRFLKASLVWLALGVSLGLLMLIWPAAILYRPAHLHLNLLGFVTMMIYGVGYHVLPRFSGHPLHSRELAGVHWWMANVGLGLLVAGFILRPHLYRWSLPLLIVGGSASTLGAFIFIYNIWRTIDGPAALIRQARSTGGLPVVDR